MGMFSEDFKLFRGVVENNKDPEKRGRVQVVRSVRLEYNIM